VFDDGHFSHREFSPAHFVKILEQFNVQAVVRLNSPQYDKDAFEQQGIVVADLYFEDCTPPPASVACKFLALAERLEGPIAVHCKAGLGRTGTLIALYMMKHHDFTAREAMGWLRIVRPGSVIGSQQQFLCEKESMVRSAGAAFRHAGGRRWTLERGSGRVRVGASVARILRDVDSRVARTLARISSQTVDLVAISGGGESAESGASLAVHVAHAINSRSRRRASVLSQARSVRLPMITGLQVRRASSFM
jgi:protein-tyrosine phosphatase